MGITSNAGKLAANWQRRANALMPEMRRATRQATNVVYAESKKQMSKFIYDKPVPTRRQISTEKKLTVKRKGKDVPAGFVTIKGRKVLVPLNSARYKSSRKKAWKRTGNLKRSEKKRVVSPYEGVIYNDAKYAKIRHDMKNTRYPATWRQSAVDKSRREVRTIYRHALKRSLRAGTISGLNIL